MSYDMGWICPICGYTYNPTTANCLNCSRPDSDKYTCGTSTTPTPLPPRDEGVPKQLEFDFDGGDE